MGRSWHARERARRVLPDPAFDKLWAAMEPRIDAMTEDALVTAHRATRRILRNIRKRRGRERAWLRTALRSG